MRKAIYFAVAIGLTLLVLCLLKGCVMIKLHAQELPQIIINEIMYNPLGADARHEWIEILNVSTSTEYVIDSGWRFNDGSNHQLAVIQGDNVIGPQEFLVLTDDSEIFLQDYPAYQSGLIDTVMSLNNTEDTLSLSVDSGQTFFATTTYQSNQGGSDNGYSLAWINQSWQESLSVKGTPGAVNVQPPTATSTIPASDDMATSTVETGDESTTTPEVVEDEASSTPEIVDNQETQNQQSADQEIAYSDQLIISEVLPNPAGSDNDDEWIELYNRGAVPIDLMGWQLSDSTTKKYSINSSDYPMTMIDAFGYFVIYRKESGIALNNNGDTVRLFQPDGNLLEQVEYAETAADNQAYAKNGGSWAWTIEPTPGYKNVIKSSADDFKCPGPQIVYVTKEVAAPAASAATSSPAEFNPDDYQGLRVNEFMPNPKGSDDAEWIELYNNSTSTLSLPGLSLDDEEGGSWAYPLPASSTMPAFTYLVVKKEDSALALNNDADAVRLLGPAKQVLQAVAYQGVKEGWSYNYDDLNDEWFWSSSSTPGQANMLSSAPVDELQPPAEAAATEENLFYSINEIKNLAKGAEVQTAGAVTVGPEILGKNMFYITEPDLSSGIQIYAGSAVIPELKLGDLVVVRGKTSQIQGEKRINLSKDSQIEIIDKVSFGQPELIAIDDLNDEQVGNLIYISGELVEKKGSNYYLDDGTGEIRMYLKASAGIVKPEVEEGYFMDVQGILTLTTSGYRLLPRFAEDINIGQIMGAVEEIRLSDEVMITAAGSQQKNVIKYSAYGGGSLLAVLLSLLIKLKFLK